MLALFSTYANLLEAQLSQMLDKVCQKCAS